MIGIVRSRDHDADIGAQRARQHGDGRGRDRPEKEDIHARGAEARDHRSLDHVAGKARVLADDHAMAVAAALKRHSGRHAYLHGDFRSHRKCIGPSPDAISTEIPSRHATDCPRDTRNCPHSDSDPAFATDAAILGITLCEPVLRLEKSKFAKDVNIIKRLTPYLDRLNAFERSTRAASRRHGGRPECAPIRAS